VRVSDGEIAVLARRLGLPDAEFRGLYTRRLRGGELSLRERRGGDCVFYEEGRGCTVHPERPRQCRTYPFWSANLHSSESWEAESEECEGIGRGPTWSAEQIETLRRDDGTLRARLRRSATRR
jgi:Fe-S-cluster containining protein